MPEGKLAVIVPQRVGGDVSDGDRGLPEGGRTDGELRPFKEGAAMLAIASSTPIVPIMLQGTREVMPMGSLLMTPGDVIVRIGDPIPTEGMSPKERGPLTERVRSAIAAMQEQSSRLA